MIRIAVYLRGAVPLLPRARFFFPIGVAVAEETYASAVCIYLISIADEANSRRRKTSQSIDAHQRRRFRLWKSESCRGRPLWPTSPPLDAYVGPRLKDILRAKDISTPPLSKQEAEVALQQMPARPKFPGGLEKCTRCAKPRLEWISANGGRQIPKGMKFRTTKEPVSGCGKFKS